MGLKEDIELVERRFKTSLAYHNFHLEWRGEDRGMYQVEVHDREGCWKCDEEEAWKRIKETLNVSGIHKENG